MSTEALEPDTGTRLRRAVAEFFEVDEGAVGPEFSLQGRRGQGSIARAALDSVIRRRVGIRSRSVYSARTYGELAVELMPGVTPVLQESHSTALRRNGQDVASPTTVNRPTVGDVRCGIDIELIEHIRKSADCWDDPFYRDHFTPAEIAYCLLQETPALHFAARWCAKEALKKCDGAFLATAMKDLEVVADDMGVPSLLHHTSGEVHRLPHAVSLSHTPHAAVAVVVKVDVPAPILPPAIAAAEDAAVPSPTPSRRSGHFVTILIGLSALGVAIAALWRTF